MTEPTAIPSAYVRAAAEPWRLRILAALEDGPRTAPSLAPELGVSRTTAWRHMRKLEQMGLVRGRHVGREIVYEAVSIPRFSDSQYGAMATTARTAMMATALAKLQVHAAAALDAGGWGRPDIHFSRSTLDVDEAGWERLTDRFHDVLLDIDNERDAGKLIEDDDQRVSVTAVLMLFESAIGEHEREPRQDVVPLGRQDDDLERAWQLHESLDEHLTESGVDWLRVLNLAEELRVISAAALAADPHLKSEAGPLERTRSRARLSANDCA
jgi:DNA-binding transcriptional ArsR family regulator